MVARALAVWVALGVALVAATVAHAEPARLAQARAAVREVRYDAARELLVGALRGGGLSPTELAEVYRLSASVAVVLGQAEVAEQYYRRWLAIDRDATLPDSVAPALRAPFVAAQAYMGVHGRLAVRATRDAADAIDVSIDDDPLKLVAGVALIADAQREPAVTPTLGRRSMKLRGSARALRAAFVDEHGNHLREIEIPALIAVEVSLVRRPVVWLGASAVALAAAGTAGLLARSADRRLSELVAAPGAHYREDATAVRDRRDRDALIANLALGAAGACLVTSAILYATAPRARLAPLASSDAVGLSVRASF